VLPALSRICVTPGCRPARSLHNVYRTSTTMPGAVFCHPASRGIRRTEGSRLPLHSASGTRTRPARSQSGQTYKPSVLMAALHPARSSFSFLLLVSATPPCFLVLSSLFSSSRPSLSTQRALCSARTAISASQTSFPPRRMRLCIRSTLVLPSERHSLRTLPTGKRDS
jgi:hypothetical protein